MTTRPTHTSEGASKMITMTGVSKRYRTTDLETTALNEVNIEIAEGEFVAIMGPSGCGKSTLLNIIGLIDSPTSGRYLLDGQDVARYGEDRLTDVRMHNVGFIFQNFNLIDDLTVQENVELPLVYQNMRREARRSRVREVLELVGLQARARHKPTQLSGGQQQRVAVARAVVCDPKLIVADEPTGNLDTKNGEDVMDMLATLNEQGATILMVTHSPSHADRAHRLINLLDGRVVPNIGADL
jgi:putative ABC transport system ATP-binding protein